MTLNISPLSNTKKNHPAFKAKIDIEDYRSLLSKRNCKKLTEMASKIGTNRDKISMLFGYRPSGEKVFICTGNFPSKDKYFYSGNFQDRFLLIKNNSPLKAAQKALEKIAKAYNAKKSHKINYFE